MKKISVLEDWKDKKAVLATMHGKELVIAPLLKNELDITVVVPKNFDSDSFGTFTRDIKRAGTQRQAARMKALAAIKLTGAEIAIASEGSFGAHPALPFISSNLELVLLIDTKNNIEIAGYHRSSTVPLHGQKAYSPEEVVEIARAWGFPSQGVILRQSEQSNRHIYKELTTEEDLKRVSKQLLSKFFARSVFVETDMRAHRCPPRMESIMHATRDLIKNCKSICPQCDTPGFVVADVINGLPCHHCGLPNDVPKETVHECQKCSYRKHELVEEKKFVEPADCEWCNP